MSCGPHRPNCSTKCSINRTRICRHHRPRLLCHSANRIRHHRAQNCCFPPHTSTSFKFAASSSEVHLLSSSHHRQCGLWSETFTPVQSAEMCPPRHKSVATTTTTTARNHRFSSMHIYSLLLLLVVSSNTTQGIYGSRQAAYLLILGGTQTNTSVLKPFSETITCIIIARDSTGTRTS